MVEVEELQRLISHDAAFNALFRNSVCMCVVTEVSSRPRSVLMASHMATSAAVTNTWPLAMPRREPFTCTAKVLKLGRRKTFGTAECVSANGDLLAYHTLTYVIP